MIIMRTSSTLSRKASGSRRGIDGAGPLEYSSIYLPLPNGDRHLVPLYAVGR